MKFKEVDMEKQTQDNLELFSYYSKEAKASTNLIFNNLPELIRPKRLSELLGISLSTVYDWKYRGKTRNIPSNLFLKINRLLFIRTEVLKRWVNIQ